MNIPYRTRQNLRRAGITLLVILVVALLVGIFWFVWLNRFVIYTRDEGAKLDMSLTKEFSQGVPGKAPENVDVSIYYNEGENALNTSRELTQISGYYADRDALMKGADNVLAQIKALEPNTPVMVDVKNSKGAFFYSSAVGSKRDGKIDTAAMDKLIDYLKTSNTYAIARLPALRDYEYGLNHVPDGLPTEKGYLWVDRTGGGYYYWLNPKSQGTITYLISIATELRNLGFDEVVFDYFYFPDTKDIVFKGDKDEALATAAKTLVTACATDSFAVSFVGQDTAFPLPEGRSRLYLANVAAVQADTTAQQTGLKTPATHLVFLTEIHDTRFDTYSVLRPLDAAH